VRLDAACREKQLRCMMQRNGVVKADLRSAIPHSASPPLIIHALTEVDFHPET